MRQRDVVCVPRAVGEGRALEAARDGRSAAARVRNHVVTRLRRELPPASTQQPQQQTRSARAMERARRMRATQARWDLIFDSKPRMIFRTRVLLVHIYAPLPPTRRPGGRSSEVRIELRMMVNWLNEISRKPAQTVVELASARQHQENPAGHHGARGGGLR